LSRVVDPRPDQGDASSEPLAASAVVSGQGTTLDRGPDGHFYADAKVNGVTVHFLVDTGASGVALSAADARRVGLPFFSNEFEKVGTGASGDVRGKLVMLDRVTLGGKSVDNVGGAILEGSEMSLLGQSFLSRIGTIEMTADRMVIR
jgi:aspartyl protease family protein